MLVGTENNPFDNFPGCPMPRSETVMSLFIASPGDVIEERDILSDVITELNAVWSRSLAVRIDLLRWEESVRPGVGQYPQAVINSQLPADYDVLVAIFWGRIGTATPEYVSGTVEELYRALDRHKNGENVEIMVYFKDAPLHPSKIDAQQLAKLHELRARLEDLGCLYRSFDDASSFESMIRSALSAVAQKMASSDSNSRILPSSTSKSAVTDVAKMTGEAEEEAEYGLLDYVDMYEIKISSLNGALGAIAEATVMIGERMTKRTGQLNALKQPDGTADRNKVRKIVDLTSEDMDQYAQVMGPQVTIMRESRIATFDAMSRAVSLQFELPRKQDFDELINLDNIIANMTEATEFSLKNSRELRETVAELPRLSMQLNRSKKQVVAVLDAVADEIMATINSANDVRRIIKEILSQQQ